MNLGLWLERAGRGRPDAPAVGLGRAILFDYGALAHRAARIAGALKNDFGVEPGERVAIIAKNCAEYVEAMYGAWIAGAAIVPVNAKLHGAEFGYILEHSGATTAFVSPGLDSTIAPFAPPHLKRMITLGGGDYQRMLQAEPIASVVRGADDLAWLFYTSGTTGRPKGAHLSHGNLAAAAYAYIAEVDPVAPGDAIYHGAPMSHGSGLYLVPHMMSFGINIIPESGGFEPAETFAAIDHWKRVSMFAAPTMVKRLVAANIDFDRSGVRTLIYGGGPMYVEDAIQALDLFGPRLAQIFGQGESPMTITTLGREDIAERDHPLWRERLGSVGRPFGMIEVAVVDADDNPLPVGEAGEIVCRGPTVMARYWNDPGASEKTLRGGWLHTGDVGIFDERGYLTLKDRSKDLIISGGTNIYPREVEEALLAHHGVQEVSVIGRPDPEWGESLVAYVVGSASEQELDALCLARIARFKRPKHYIFVEALPKNNYGKVVKTELRELDRQHVARAASPD